jgi:septum site-determining protein MinC
VNKIFLKKEKIMATKQIVTLKGQRDGINIILDAYAPFKEIKESLRKKVSQGKNFFDGAEIKISFSGRTLDEFSEKVLLDIIIEETDSEIIFTKNEASVFRDANDSPKPVPAVSAPQKPAHRESPTAYYHTGLRSGQRIKYEGSVVIMGDVNPGSEIIADGNVIVLGTLKGLAHAGANGDATCFVSALSLQPTQLRIAGTISFVPPNAAKNSPAYAYIKEGQVFIGQL